ncbi:unnamed protein product [Trifolium pratense]|uniref:Uncharacterized protein n=1 Tax=Trifolium pratense TaxID=57577 RepID=A0ACB0J2U4_TRIPR|nr:unnamed protein product [Trifolium pratense]
MWLNTNRNWDSMVESQQILIQESTLQLHIKSSVLPLLVHGTSSDMLFKYCNHRKLFYLILYMIQEYDDPKGRHTPYTASMKLHKRIF